MKNIIKCLFITFASVITLGCTKSFLTREPLDTFDDGIYWTNEANVRTYAMNFYLTYFIGYSNDFTTFGGFFTGDKMNDDIAVKAPTPFPRNITESAGSWSYGEIRRANILLHKVQQMSMNEETTKHWMGVARFFRAMAYSTLVKAFGDVPYIDQVPQSNDYDYLYKAKTPRTEVVDKIMEDFTYAINNIRDNDGALQVNKYVAAAYMSRWMLFHATWLKYHGTTVGPTTQPVNSAKLKTYFDAAILGAQTVMNTGKYKIGNTYNELFTSENLSGNPEVIFYREYASGKVTNALMSYNAVEEQAGGASKNCIDSYLCDDGLPIKQSPSYQGNTNPEISGVFANRDPRLYQCFVDSIKLNGIYGGFSPTGYISKKFLNEGWLASGSSYVTGVLSPANSPVMRYAEVLLNYVEARYEVSKIGGKSFSQNDLDSSINMIRTRQLVKWKTSIPKSMPKVTLTGSSLSANGVIINDPDRDPTVDPILWEIRRERRIELIMEGRRNEDLNRWGKFKYLETGTTTAPTTINMGAWVVKAKYKHLPNYNKLFEGTTPSIKLYYPTADESAGYVWIAYTANLQRAFNEGNLNSERAYLNSIPIAQINLYKGKGYQLQQNPGWE